MHKEFTMPYIPRGRIHKSGPIHFSSSISQHHSFGFKTLCSMLGWEENKIGREQKLRTVGNHIFGVIASVSSHYTVELVHFVPN